ncbi:hypothetical protein [Halomarina oriensis]|uniref:Uncharacterized protein n=1 Tax=Halomarina oriensis TaxID=671145 RepID=A0A6B0GJK4_9EURY|nr:hypothetical protein [Halomarina oriensis]MWG34984.1 hypothetical protein [Halomarina oriensis]
MSTTLQHRRRTPAETDGDALARDATTCPDCAESLVEGQGLVTCTDCRWVGSYR